MAMSGSIPPVRLLSAAALATALAACQPAAPPAQDPGAAADAGADAVLPFEGLAPGERINFQCADLGVGATFDEGGDSVRLSFSGQRLELPAVDAATGFRFADDAGNELWSAGGDQTALILAGQERRECFRSNRPSPWDVAADNGIDFRAIGQEPGWLVELVEGEGDGGATLTAHLDYGQRLLEADGLQREGDSWSGQAADDTGVTLTVEERACADAMSGEQFRAGATLVVDGEQYEGCGAWLQAD